MTHSYYRTQHNIPVLDNGIAVESCILTKKSTINGERFAELNFCIFHSFQDQLEYRESFSVNVI